MRTRLWPAVAVSFGALLLFSTLFALLVSREAARIHERAKIAHQIYQRADDAISDIQANINKGALIEQSGFNNPNVVETENRIAELQRNTADSCTTLIQLIGANQKPQILALQQGLDQYWNSIQQSLSTSRTRQGEQTLFSELENQPGKVLDLAGRIDALNQASLAREEQESEAQQTKLRQIAIAATLMLLMLECGLRYSARPICIGWIESQRQSGNAPRRQNKSSGVYPINWCASRRRREKQSLENFTTK